MQIENGVVLPVGPPTENPVTLVPMQNNPAGHEGHAGMGNPFDSARDDGSALFRTLELDGHGLINPGISKKYVSDGACRSIKHRLRRILTSNSR